MKCKKCGNEVDKKAVICPGCGCKIKKPFYTKWWFFGILIILVIAVASSGNDSSTDTSSSKEVEKSVETTAESITYETVDLAVMFEELKNNAMKAENNYQKKNIEFTAKIKSFDSDGKYVSVEPTTADEWNFESAMCYIKNDEQKNFLIEKSVGDTITIKGKVKSIGEVLGYSIDIAEVQ